MGSILEAIEDWIRGLLVSGIIGNLTSIFDSVNNQVGQIATEVGRTPASFSPAVYGMIRTLSENVIMPIAGLILTFIACYELIQLVISHNNLANFETWIFWKWIFKTFVAVTLITNTMNITMAVFDVAQHVVSQAGGFIGGLTAVDEPHFSCVSFLHPFSRSSAGKREKMTKEKNTVGSRIRECRKALGLSQEALAELLYMKKNTISRYENDEHDIPSSNIVALAEALETTPDYLLLGKTEEEPWMKDVIRVLGSIKDPAMRKLALDQLKCIASV